MAPSPAGKSTPSAYKLPDGLTGPVDVARLGRELEALENYMQQAKLRAGGKPVKLPKTTRVLDDMAGLNGLNLLETADRAKLAAAVNLLITKAPVMQISFAVEPSAAFVAKLVAWLRSNISPYVLVRIGKQPTIGGGCVVRTTNKRFDFSFGQYLHASRGKLADVIGEVAAR